MDGRKPWLMTLAFIMLSCSFLLLIVRADAADAVGPEDYPESGVAITDFDELSGIEGYQYLGEEDPPTLGASSGPAPPSTFDSPPPDGALLEQTTAIREDIHIFLYGVLPVMIAAVLLYKFCIWFYRTFIEGALG